MYYNALIPIKSLLLTKSRLASMLSIDQRKLLTTTMATHVITTLKDSANISQITIVTSDPMIISLAQRFGIGIFPDRKKGLNKVLSEAALVQQKEVPLLTIFSDLPLLTINDISTLVISAEYRDIVLAPSKEKTGTNAVFMKSPLLIPYFFGENSCKKFHTAAQQQQFSIDEVSTKTLAFDIDLPEDIKNLQGNPEYTFL